MGFFKKIKKAFKKVTKPVSKVVKAVAKPVAKVVKPVGKAILPLAGQVLSAYAGNYLGGKVTEGLGSVFGVNDVTKGLGKAVSQGVQNTVNSIGQKPVMSAGVSMPTGYNGSITANRPKTTIPAPPALSTPNKDLSQGVGFIKNMETPIKSAAEQGKDTKDYLAAAYPNMNEWERSGTGGTMFGSEMTGDIQSQEAQNKALSTQMALQKQQMEKDYSLAELNANTQLIMNQNNNNAALTAAQIASETSQYTAGINSMTSRANTRDNLELGYSRYELEKTRLDSDIQKIAADTDMSRQNKEESISRTINNYAQTNNIKMTGNQIQALTQQALAAASESGARRGLIGQQTVSESLRQPGIVQTNENLRYGSGNVAREALSVSNAIGDAAGGLWDNVKNYFSKATDGVSGAVFPLKGSD